MIAKQAEIKVAAEIDQGLLAIADAFAVDDPFCRQWAGQQRAGVFQYGEQLAAKDFGKRLMVEEVAGLRPPAPLPGVERCRRHR